LKASLDPQIAISKTYDAFVTATAGDTLAGAGVCDDAAKLSGQLDGLIDLGQTPARLETYTEAAQRLRQAHTAFVTGTSGAMPASAACQAEKKAAVSDAATLLGEASDFESAVKKLQDQKASFESMKGAVTDVFAETHPFVQPYYPPTVGSATAVTVAINRTNLRQSPPKEERVATVLLQIGESAVSVSAGFAFTTALDRRIGRVSAMVPATSGSDVAGNRFGYLADSRYRPLAVLMLNARMPRLRGRKMGWWPDVLATGIGFQPDGGTSARNDFIPVAGGWRFLNEHVLLTVGLHLSKGDCLPDDGKKNESCGARPGFKIGDVVPAAQTDPLSLQRFWSSGLLIGVTFRTQ
jgi:hypothetical protein